MQLQQRVYSGALNPTDNDFDFAIEGKGFLVYKLVMEKYIQGMDPFEWLMAWKVLP